MFARMATFEGVDDCGTDDGRGARTRRADDAKDAGVPGLQELMDRSGGTAVTLAFFDSEENMQAAERTFDEEMPSSSEISSWSNGQAGARGRPLSGTGRRAVGGEAA